MQNMQLDGPSLDPLKTFTFEKDGIVFTSIPPSPISR